MSTHTRIYQTEPTAEAPQRSSIQAHLRGNWFAHEADRLLEATRTSYDDVERHGDAAATLALVVAVDEVTACLKRHAGALR